MPRSLVHVLLSLLLLVSQQLSLGHGYTHWRDAGETLAQAANANAALAVTGAEADDDGIASGKLPKPGLHDLCGQCAASAQAAFALPSTLRQFAPSDLAYAAPSLPQRAGACAPSACPFDSRAPPRLG